jgi:hypothetical protein
MLQEWINHFAPGHPVSTAISSPSLPVRQSGTLGTTAHPVQFAPPIALSFNFDPHAVMPVMTVELVSHREWGVS